MIVIHVNGASIILTNYYFFPPSPNLIVPRVMTHFLLDNYQTITDLVERSLRKGRGPEQVAAARLATMLVVSLSPVPEAEKVYFLIILMYNFMDIENIYMFYSCCSCDI